LVAHHSGARFEAAERGLTAELDVDPLEHSAVADALMAADLTTGPAGERLTFDERLDEILTCYPADSVVPTTGRPAGDPETAADRAAARAGRARPGSPGTQRRRPLGRVAAFGVGPPGKLVEVVPGPHQRGVRGGVDDLLPALAGDRSNLGVVALRLPGACPGSRPAR
jgi:hypothetical protein